MGLLRTALIFGVGYAVGDASRRRQLVNKANDLAKRPEVQKLQERGRTAVARVTRRTSSGSGQEAGATGSDGAATGRRWRPLPYRRSAAGSSSPVSTGADAGTLSAGSTGATAASDLGSASNPDSTEFLQRQNPVEKVSPDTTADAPATDPNLLPTDPSRPEERPST